MQKAPKVILLAAGVGRRFGPRTKKLPKCLIPLSPGENLLRRYLRSFRLLKLQNVVVVVGHEKEQIKKECARSGKGLDIRYVTNPDFKKGSIVSLARASDELKEDCLVMDADVYFEARALQKILKSARSSFLIDPRSKSTGEEMMLMARRGRPVKISKKVDPSLVILGEATGFFKIKGRDGKLLGTILKKMVGSGHTGLEYEESYNELMKKRKVGFEKISGFWTEMDFEEDLKKIRRRR